MKQYPKDHVFDQEVAMRGYCDFEKKWNELCPSAKISDEGRSVMIEIFLAGWQYRASWDKTQDAIDQKENN